MLRLLTLNCKGARRRNAGVQLEELLFANRIGSAVTAETHLRGEEVERLRLNHYAGINDCSKDTVGRIGGGW